MIYNEVLIRFVLLFSGVTFTCFGAKELNFKLLLLGAVEIGIYVIVQGV